MNMERARWLGPQVTRANEIDYKEEAMQMIASRLSLERLTYFSILQQLLPLCCCLSS